MSNYKEVIDEEDMYGEGFFNTTRALIYGRNDYPPKGREIIKQYGDKMIQSLTIIRHPVQQAIVELLNAFSFGAWKKNMSKQPYDKLFHLGLIVQFEDGTVILAEKNEVINLTNIINVDKKAETKRVDNLRQGITLKTMLDNAQKNMGSKYFTYSAYDNNCQYYIMNLLKGIGAGSEQDFNFIKQNTEELFEANPSLIGISDKVTSTGAFVNVLTQGGKIGTKGGSINNQLKEIYKKKNNNNNINNMSNSKVMKKMKELMSMLQKTDISGDVEIPKYFIQLGEEVKRNFSKSMKGKGDFMHIDVGSHNDTSSEEDEPKPIRKRRFKGGALEHEAGAPHAGLSSANPVPEFLSQGDTKKIISQNALLNNLTGKDLTALKMLSGHDPLHTPGANAKTVRENAKRIASEIKLLKGKERTVKKRASRFAKGSPEALEWGRKMREARLKK